ncbi:Ger(x)C family spore germination protein [Cohnella terricola]|uniref:Ger(X)C family spore germination protein n=1 Tax=Cohnella terricola TaxID=1289167 RepID=A0A559JIL1_9BACL|nr:Ger(x)C family spore germination protein [Cohnella terricola]TVX99707.1 Ger(x)C family spore germination protein [Cohnella terricola]
MSRRFVCTLTVAVALAVCGCWDQQLLKNERTVSIGGMDEAPKGKLRATVSIRDTTITEAGSKDTSEIHTVVARSTQHARQKIDEEVSGIYSAAKLRVLLFGEELVRNHDIMPFLDVYYRDPKSPLSARIAVARGTAEELIRLKMVGDKTIGLYVDDLLKSMELDAAIPQVNIQTLHPLDRGFDFSLPLLAVKRGVPAVQGMALFNGIRLTETLNLDESRVYLLLTGLGKQNLRMTLQPMEKNKSSGYQYVTINVKKIRRSLKVIVADDQEIQVRLNLKLRVAVEEDPSNHLYKMSVMHNLERLLSEELTDNSKKIIRKMQKAGHDGCGVARRLMAFHPKLWKRIDWKKEYPQVRFDTRVSLEIVNTGITQ